MSTAAACCKEGAPPDEWGPPIALYDPYGPGEDLIIEKVADQVLERVSAPPGHASPAVSHASPDEA